jgi:hypothetical protein
MVGRAVTSRAERRSEGSSMLPTFGRIAPAVPIGLLVSEIEASTKPGEAIVDLAGRGGWVARAAIAGQRRAVDVEELPITRLIAEVVIRPPDERHLEAAAQAISLKPLLGTTLKDALAALFASRCPTCGGPVALDALVWDTSPGRRPAASASGVPRAVRREFRCDACQRQRGKPDFRHAPPTPDDLARAAFADLPPETREALRARFPVAHPDSPLPDQLLDLHSPRQLVGLNAILEGIELETRAAPLAAALRMAFLLAVESASKLNAYRGRPPDLRISGGALRLGGPHSWRERNPWPAFLYGLEAVRAFVARLEADEQRSVSARFAPDLMDLQQGVANVVLSDETGGALRRLGIAGERISHSGTPSRVRLALSQAPLPMTRERLTEAYYATAWALGSAAASTLPIDSLFATGRPPRRSAADELAYSLARTLVLAGPVLAPNGRAVTLLDDSEPRTLVAAALGGAAAGWRLVEARIHRDEAGSPAVTAFVPPSGVAWSPARTRPNQPLAPLESGAGDPAGVPGRGVFAAPEKLAEGPFQSSAAALAVSDTAVEILRARGEPACFDDLLGDLLIGLDRSGQLARLARQLRPQGAEQGWDSWVDAREPPASVWAAAGGAGAKAAAGAAPDEPPDEDRLPESGSLAEELLSLIRGEMDRRDNKRIRRLEAEHYWLGVEEDRSGAAQPLADRVEWSVFSLISSARQIAEGAVYERVAGMFQDRDAPDRALVEACLRSYSGPGSTPATTFTSDRLERRSAEHDALIATLADLGHRLGMRVWIGRRQQTRKVEGRPLSDWLGVEEREVHPSMIAWGPEAELDRVDCAWYARHRVAFLFEVEWTAMLGDPVLVRHARFPIDDNVVRFLVVPPERAPLVAHKLTRSPLLRQAFAERNWHVLKWDQLLAFAAREEVSLADLEPFVGLEASAAAAEQLPMFEV